MGKPYWDDPSVKATELHGNLEQLYHMKTKNRHLKTMLSIGGFTDSRTYIPILESESMRETFARTAVKQMYNLGFDGLSLDYEYVDGLSLDYEYVASPTEAKQMVDLLKRIRSEMDK
jgi:chitinase